MFDESVTVFSSSPSISLILPSSFRSRLCSALLSNSLNRDGSTSSSLARSRKAFLLMRTKLAWIISDGGKFSLQEQKKWKDDYEEGEKDCQKTGRKKERSHSHQKELALEDSAKIVTGIVKGNENRGDENCHKDHQSCVMRSWSWIPRRIG